MSDGILVRAAEQTEQPIILMQPVRSGPGTTNGLEPTNTSMNSDAVSSHFEFGQPIYTSKGKAKRIKQLVSQGDPKFHRNRRRDVLH